MSGKEFFKKDQVKFALFCAALFIAVLIFHYFFISAPRIDYSNLVSSQRQLSDPAIVSVLLEQVFSYNAGYLTISITILILLAGAWAFFNFKPLQTKLEEHEEELKKMKGEALSKIETSLNKLELDFKESLQEIELKHKLSEIDNIWNLHYLWQVQNLHEIDLDTLIRHMEKAVEYGLSPYALVFDQIIRILSVPNLVISTPQRRQDFVQRIQTIFTKIQGFEEEKKKVSEKLINIMPG